LRLRTSSPGRPLSGERCRRSRASQTRPPGQPPPPVVVARGSSGSRGSSCERLPSSPGGKTLPVAATVVQQQDAAVSPANPSHLAQCAHRIGEVQRLNEETAVSKVSSSKGRVSASETRSPSAFLRATSSIPAGSTAGSSPSRRRPPAPRPGRGAAGPAAGKPFPGIPAASLRDRTTALP
jgi:hypothetical protein